MATKKKEKTVPEKIEDAVVDAVKKAASVVEGAVEEAVENVVESIEGKTNKKANKETNETKEAPSDDKKAKIAALRAKAKALEGKVSEKHIDIKSEVKGDKEEKKDTLVPIEDYLKSSIHLGTRVITPDMRKYVYRRRADGLAVFNTALLDDKIREGAEFLSKYSPEDIVLVCKREAGWKAANKFAETLGIKVFTKKYPSGVLTNTNLENFFEKELVFICDPWLDKNALNDARRVKIKVMSICDTNNFTNHIECVIPGNNKSWKSLGMIFYLLTKYYIEKRKLDINVPQIQEFVEGWDNLQPPA